MVSWLKLKNISTGVKFIPTTHFTFSYEDVRIINVQLEMSLRFQERN